MSKQSDIDGHLSEALDKICATADIIREIDELDDVPTMGRLGKAIEEIWEVRERIFTLWPEVQPDSSDVAELVEVYRKRFKASQAAEALLTVGDLTGAQAAYEKIMTRSHGFFKMEAEAALYRISQAEKS